MPTIEKFRLRSRFRLHAASRYDNLPEMAAKRRKPAKRRTTGPTDPIARLRAICLSLPEANERTSHGEPTWFAGKGKVFAMLDNHHHGSDHIAVWLPQPFGVQTSLIDADPK